MAVTRIKNNQITDSTITAQKIADGTLVGSLFSPDVTFDSNITITGDLSITGNTSTINSTNTYVEDPLVVFNNGFSGSPSYDIGILINRNLASLAPYGAVNAAWVWQESESAFAGLMTTETGNTLGSIDETGFANLRIGNVSAVSISVSGSIDLTGTITAGGIVNTPISGSTGYFTTAHAVNFSTANARISGGQITTTPVSGSTGHFTTLQGTNFSSGNIRVSGGYISALANATITTTNTTTLNAATGTIAQLNTTSANATTLVSQNLSSGNVRLTGGYATGLANVRATTGQFNNFSSGNVLIAGGDISNTPISGSTGYFTTAQSTNFSSGNVLVTGGNVTGLTNLQSATANFNTATTAQLNSTSGNVATLVSTNFSAGNVQVTGGSVTGLTNLQSATANFNTATSAQLNASAANVTGPLFSSSINTANAVITGGYVNNLANITATNATLTNTNGTTAVFTNLSSGNIVSTGSTAGTWSTANVSLYTRVTGTSANITVYPQFVNKLTGNAESYTNSNFYFNPSTGTLHVPTVVTTGDQNFDTIYVENFSSGNVAIFGGYINSLANVSATTGVFSTTNTEYLNNTHGNITVLYAENFSTANAAISGGYVQNLANLSATTAVTTNFSTGNAQISGGDVTGITTGSFTTLQATNFSSANVRLTGGYASGMANVRATTGQFNNLSSGNVLITGGAITGSTGHFTTLQGNNFSTGNAQISGGDIRGINQSTATTLYTQNFSSPNVQVTGGSVTGLTQFTATTAQATNFSSANARVTSGYADNFHIGANVSATGGFTTIDVSTSIEGSGSAFLTMPGDISTDANFNGTQFLSTNTALFQPNVSNYSGERVRLYDFEIIGKTNYAIGVEQNHIWHGVDTNLEGQGFKWYGNTTPVMRLSGAGNLTLSNTFTAWSVKSPTIGNVGTVLTGTLSTSSQPNVTSLGSLTGLTVTGSTNLSTTTASALNATTGNVTTLAVGNFSSGNVRLTGGYVTGMANVRATTGQFNNLSSGNVLISGGDINGLDSFSATTAYATNFSTGNAQISGGDINGIATGSFTTLQATNFSSGNAQVTGGDINDITTGSFTTLQATNFSSGNVRLTGGYATGLANVRATTAQFDNFSSSNVLISGGDVNDLTSLSATTAYTTNFGSGNAQITGGDINGIATTSATTAVATNFSTGNAQVTGGDINGIATGSFTTLQATNFSSGNTRVSGGYADNFPIGANTAATGDFTEMTASGIVTITNDTNSLAYTDGAVVVYGGLGVYKDVHIGGNLFVSNIFAQSQSELTISDPLVYLTANTMYPYDYDIGFFSHFIGGSGNVYQHTGLARDHVTNTWNFFSNIDLEPNHVIPWGDPDVVWDPIKAGELHLANTTTSTSTSTGALTVAGGAGIAGELYVGGAISAASASFASINNTPVGNTVPSTGAFTYLVATTGFSTANAQITGGTIENITTIQSDNFSSGNALITGGDVNGIATGSFTTLQATNFSTGNAQVTGGDINDVNTLSATTAHTINFSTGNAQVTGGDLNGITTGSFTTLQANNLSSSNVRLTGGYVTGLSNVRATTGQFNNLSSSNVLISGGDVNGLTSFSATTAHATNFSTGNAQISGGDVNDIATTSATTAVATNFSTGNAQVTGGDINGIATGSFTTLQATNFSTGNAQISGGNVTGLTTLSVSTAEISGGNLLTINSITATNTDATTAVATNFSTGNAQVTGGDINGIDTGSFAELQATDFSSGNVVISGGYVTGLANVSASLATVDVINNTQLNSTTGNVITLVATNFSTGNAQISGGDVNGIATTSATTAVATNFSTGNAQISGGDVTGLTTLSATTAQSTNFSSGNVLISGGDINGITTGSFTTLQATNFSTGNAQISGGDVNGIVTGSFTTLQATNFSTGNAQISGGTILAPVVSGTVVTGNVSLYQRLTAATVDTSYYVPVYNKLTGNAAAYTDAQLTYNPVTDLLSVPSLSATNGTVTNLDSTTLFATNFGSGNVRVSGGYINNLSNISATTGNFSTTNSTYVNVFASNVTTGYFGSLNTANAVITGGYINNLANLSADSAHVSDLMAVDFDATNGNVVTQYAQNFSTANAQITGGSITGVTDLTATTMHAQNFSSGNIRVSGGYISGLANATITTVNTTTLNAGTVDVTQLNGTNGNVTTLVVTNFSSGNAQITGGKIIGLSNIEATGGFVNNFGADHIGVNSITANALSVFNAADVFNLTATSVVSGNVTFTGDTFGTVSTANVSLYNYVTTNAIDANLYPVFVDTLTGNTQSYVDGDYFYNPVTGKLYAADFVGSGEFSNLQVSGQSVLSGIVTIDNDIPCTGVGTGALVITGTGGLGVSGNIVSGADVSAESLYANVIGTTGSQIYGQVQDGSQTSITTLGTLTGLQSDGNVVINSTTDSNSMTSGALIVAGGAALGANLVANVSAEFNYSRTPGQDFIVRGTYDDTLLWARPSTGNYDQLVFGGNATTATLVDGAKVIFNTTDSMVIPTGTTVQRPSSVGGTDVAGMLRFNTTTGSIEWYNGAGWQTAGTLFTIIISQTFNGDDVTTDFTLSAESTTASAIVSINGVVQIPQVAYTINGSLLEFSQPPATGDLIDIRILTTSQDVGSILSANGRMGFGAEDSAAYVLTGTVQPTRTTYWEPTGAKVGNLANIAVSSAETPTTLDSFDPATYRTAKYLVQVTNGTNYQSQEVLVVHDGTTSSATTYAVVQTNGNLGVVSSEIQSGNVALKFTATTSSTIVRITKDYLLI